MGKLQRIIRDRRLTEEEVAKYDRLRAQIEAELPELLARERIAPSHACHEDILEVEQLVALLRVERERQNIDLEEIARRTHYRLEDLQCMENNRYPNPHLAMLTRYARALGKRVMLSMRQGEPWRDPRKHEVPAEAGK